MDICIVEESFFQSDDLDDLLSMSCDIFSVYYDGRSKGVSRLVSHSLNVVCMLVFADLNGRLCVVGAIIKYQAFCLIAVYPPIDHS